MIKNICIMFSVIFCMTMTSCKLNFMAETATQKFSGSVTIYDMDDDDSEIRVVNYKK